MISIAVFLANFNKITALINVILFNDGENRLMLFVKEVIDGINLIDKFTENINSREMTKVFFSCKGEKK